MCYQAFETSVERIGAGGDDGHAVLPLDVSGFGEHCFEEEILAADTNDWNPIAELVHLAWTVLCSNEGLSICDAVEFHKAIHGLAG